MIRKLLLAALACVSVPLAAQSLEESYAKLCSGESKSSETCATLRSALQGKLAGGETSVARAKPGAISPKWRFWAPLAGKALIDENGELHRFEWEDRGLVLRSVRQRVSGDEVSRYTLQADGSVIVEREGTAPLRLEPTGTASFALLSAEVEGAPRERWRYSASKTGIDIVQESQSGARWSETGVRRSRTLASADQLAAAEVKLAAAREQAVMVQWKALAKMVGKEYLFRYKSGTSEDRLMAVRWLEVGRKAEMRWTALPSGALVVTHVLTLDPATGRISAVASDGYHGTTTTHPDRITTLWANKATGRGNLYTDLTPATSGLTLQTGRDKKGNRRDKSDDSYLEVTGIDKRKLAEAAAHSLAQRKEAFRQQQAQNSGGGDMFGRMLGGALMGAMLGGGGQNSIDLAITGAQAAASGGNTYEVLTAMNGVMATKVEEGQRQLDATIARAEAQAAADREAKRREELAEAEKKAATAAEAQRIRESAARENAANQAETRRRQEEAAKKQVAVAQAPAKPAAGASSAAPERAVVYFSCIGRIAKYSPEHKTDIFEASYYGIVVGRFGDNDAARDLFQRHTGSQTTRDSERPMTSCHPDSTRAEAQGYLDSVISRDSKIPGRKITGINLSL